jgi:membrane-associated protease RseP (regulator of RpoE activity)
MTMFRSTWVLAAAGLLAFCGASYGQSVVVGGAAAEPNVDVEVARPSEYWIGLILVAPSEEDAEQGLEVADVMPGGPAAKAGIQTGDRLLKAGGKPVEVVGDLIGAIAATQGKPLALKLVRDGKEQKLDVTPEKRPAPAQPFHELLPPGQDWEEGLRQWMEKMQQGQLDQPGPFRFRFFGPGAILPPDAGKEELQPEDMTITVTKKGDSPAKVVVKQGDKAWRTTEDKLGELPDEVQPHVERLLGRGVGVWGRARFIQGPKVRRQVFGPGELKPVPGDAIRNRLEERLKRMDDQIEELRKSLDELREKSSNGAGPEAPPGRV